MSDRLSSVTRSGCKVLMVRIQQVASLRRSVMSDGTDQRSSATMVKMNMVTRLLAPSAGTNF